MILTGWRNSYRIKHVPRNKETSSSIKSLLPKERSRRKLREILKEWKISNVPINRGNSSLIRKIKERRYAYGRGFNEVVELRVSWAKKWVHTVIHTAHCIILNSYIAYLVYIQRLHNNNQLFQQHSSIAIFRTEYTGSILTMRKFAEPMSIREITKITWLIKLWLKDRWRSILTKRGNRICSIM